MEVSGGLSEFERDFVVKLEGLLDDGPYMLRDGSLELGEMLVHEGGVDGVEGGSFGEVDGQEPEPTLEAGVDDERSGGGVHGGDVRGVGDLLHDELLLVIPMRVVEMLTHEGNSSLGLIGILLGHVHVIDEVEELGFARGSETSTTHLHEL
jgi:hypothetical protein